MSDAIIEGRGSVSYIEESKDKDELVEIDETGEPVVTRKGEKVKVVTKKAKKKTIKTPMPPVAAIDEVIDTSEASQQDTSSVDSVAKKKVAKKKAKKKVAKKKARRK